MGEYSEEVMFTVPPERGAALARALAGQDKDAVFATLIPVWQGLAPRASFLGYSYDHAVYLDWLLEQYGTGAVTPLTDYAEAPPLRLRHLTDEQAAKQANGILNLLAQVHRKPERLLPMLQNERERTHQSLINAHATRFERDAGAFGGHYEKAITNSNRAMRDFDLSAKDLLRLIDLAPIGGYDAGKIPPELADLNDRYAPHSKTLITLAQSFGFLKTLVEPYEAASFANQHVVHIQAYGS